jgi:hypothetical protein
MYLHSPNAASWRGAQLKHRDNKLYTDYECRNKLTSYMLLSSSWKSNRRSAGQQNHCLSWIHYSVHKNPPLVPNLSRMNPIHTLKSSLSRCFLLTSIQAEVLHVVLSFNIFRLNFSMYLSSFHTCYMPRPSHPLWFGHPKSIWWRQKPKDSYGPQVSNSWHLKYIPYRCMLMTCTLSFT